MIPRAAQPQDIRPTAQLWHDAWHETQAPHVPDALIAQRSLSSFIERLTQIGDLLRVAGPVGAPVGMCAVKNSELHQLFVTPTGRGIGIAATLLADAERRMFASGVTSAFLHCLIENTAAIKFYTRNVWINHGVEVARLDTLKDSFDLPCLIFRKDLA